MFRGIFLPSDPDRRGQLAVDAVSAVLDADHTAAPTAGYHRNGFAAVAAQGKQERVQLPVIGLDMTNDVLFAQLGSCQIHALHPFLLSYVD